MSGSAQRRTVPRVQRRTPWERVAKNHHVRRQLRRPRGVPLSQNLARCCTHQHNRAPNFRLFGVPSHRCPPLVEPLFSQHSGQLRLDCVKIQAGQEPERGHFLTPPEERRAQNPHSMTSSVPASVISHRENPTARLHFAPGLGGLRSRGALEINAARRLCAAGTETLSPSSGALQSGEPGVRGYGFRALSLRSG